MALNWEKIAASGIIAGAVFMAVEMILVGTVGGGSPWGPPRMIAAIAMGEGVLPPPATFALGPVIVAMLVHFALSALLAFIFAAVMGSRRGNEGMMLVAGAIFGLIVYFVNFYGMTAFFPWFEMARGWIGIVAHLIFGLVLGWALSRGSAVDKAID